MPETGKISKKSDFIRLYRKGSFHIGSRMVMYVLKNKFGFNRLGVSISKKFGKAVKRNKMRRRIKEHFILFSKEIHEGYDIVIMINKPSPPAEFSDIGKEIRYLLRKHDIIF